jgi:predicted negative regulator of RcsB-dependent stress response
MAHLDFEEQEQIDRLKQFWNRFGTLISSLLLVIAGAWASWNGYQYWQRHEAAQAAALFDEVERFAREGDAAKLQRAVADIQQKFSATFYAQQAGLLSAQVLLNQGQSESAKTALRWVAEHAKDAGFQSVARLRWSGVLLDEKLFDEALKVLDAPFAPSFEPLAADRKGDIYWAQGHTQQAIESFQLAYKGLGAESADYRRMVDVKLAALGSTTQSGPER